MDWRLCLAFAVVSGLVQRRRKDYRQKRDTALPLFYQLSNEFFQGYGCWCHFNQMDEMIPVKTHGKPVDQWDNACKKVQDAYQCAMMEFGKGCVPWKEFYRYSSIIVNGVDPKALTAEAIEEYCEIQTAANFGAGCMRAACIVDWTFDMLIHRVLVPEFEFKKEHLHLYGFDPSKNCSRVPVHQLEIVSQVGDANPDITLLKTDQLPIGIPAIHMGAADSALLEFNLSRPVVLKNSFETREDSSFEVESTSTRSMPLTELTNELSGTTLSSHESHLGRSISQADMSAIEEKASFLQEERMCCGRDYPMRFPYKAAHHDCCSGKIKPVGACH